MKLGSAILTTEKLDLVKTYLFTWNNEIKLLDSMPLVAENEGLNFQLSSMNFLESIPLPRFFIGLNRWETVKAEDRILPIFFYYLDIFNLVRFFLIEKTRGLKISMIIIIAWIPSVYKFLLSVIAVSFLFVPVLITGCEMNSQDQIEHHDDDDHHDHHGHDH